MLLGLLDALGRFMLAWFAGLIGFSSHLLRPIHVRLRLARRRLRQSRRSARLQGFRQRLLTDETAGPAGQRGFRRFWALLRVLFRRPHFYRTLLNYAMPLAACWLFLTVVGHVSSMNFAVAVEYNGTQLGYVRNEAVFDQAETRLQDRMVYLEGEDVVKESSRFVVTVVDENELVDESTLADGMIRSSEDDIVEATGLLIDGQFYGAVRDGSVLRRELSRMLDEYRTENPDETVSFLKDVKTEAGIYRTRNLVSEATMLETLSSELEKDVYYEIVLGDAPISIARKNDMALDELLALNPDLMTNCRVGQQVLVKKSQSLLPVKVTRTEVYTEDVPFKYDYVDSPKYYEGTRITSRLGVKGEQSVTAEVDYVDGIEVGRRVQQVNLIKEPVNAVILRGSLAMPTVSTVTDAMRSEQGFIWPVWGGYISQYYKGSRHNGIDYAYHGRSGSPIVAALPGKVIFTGTRGTYGKLVILETMGGIQTWYAHCSKITVSVGQQVKQGQQIANVGSTGRSSGPHLHFRVLVNNVEKNPMHYLP